MHAAASMGPRNRLLASLPPEVLAHLLPRLVPVEMTLRQVLHPAEAVVEAAYFPEVGYVSMLAYLAQGDLAEVALVGAEGFVGMAPLLGAASDDLEAMVQGPGTALRIDAAALREEAERAPALRMALQRFALVLFSQVARTAACNGRHQINQRLARWLLSAHDRTEGDTFPMTHEFLAMMLGVRRAGVTVAAGELQSTGCIHYERGRMTVTDRARLEAASCDCYQTVRASYQRLLG